MRKGMNTEEIHCVPHFSPLTIYKFYSLVKYISSPSPMCTYTSRCVAGTYFRENWRLGENLGNCRRHQGRRPPTVSRFRGFKGENVIFFYILPFSFFFFYHFHILLFAPSSIFIFFHFHLLSFSFFIIFIFPGLEIGKTSKNTELSCFLQFDSIFHKIAKLKRQVKLRNYAIQERLYMVKTDIE